MVSEKGALALPILNSDRLLLRMLDPSEASLPVHYHSKNKDYLRPYYPEYPPDFFTEEFWRDQLARNIEEFQDDRAVRFFIFEKSNPERVVGTANFSGIVRRAAQYCVLGYGLDEDYQGRGYMTEALETAISYMFESLNIHRVMANYIPTNEKSGKVLRRLGFDVEGYARDYLFLNGEWQDHILTARTNHGWQADYYF